MTSTVIRKRLLILGPLGPPHISDQVEALVERGFEVCVGGTATEALDAGEITIDGVRLELMPDYDRSTPIGMAKTVRWVRRLLGEFRPDLVQAHWIPGFGFAAALARARPLALTAWGSDVYRAGAIQARANRFALRRADLVLADSEDLLARCRELGAPPQRCEPIQWGVDLSLFSPPQNGDRAALRERLGLGDGPVILSPRSLMAVYNIPTILDSFRLVGEALPDAQLVLKHMGFEGIELPPFPHPERVHLVGSVPYAEMADYYRAADVCVSVTSSDSSPRSIWEAMASGLPCVLSDLPWVEEIVAPAGAALTVAVGDPSATADALQRVLLDPKLAARLRERGLAVAAGLDREAQMDRLASLLDQIGAEPSAREERSERPLASRSPRDGPIPPDRRGSTPRVSPDRPLTRPAKPGNPPGSIDPGSGGGR